MAKKKTPRPEGYRFIFPDAQTRKERLGKLLPEFLAEHSDAGELPNGFQEAVETLVRITTDRDAFDVYLETHQDGFEFRESCTFISEKTRSKEGAARKLQNELLHGLMERVSEYGLKEEGSYSKASSFLSDTIHFLMSNNVHIFIFEAKKIDRRIRHLPESVMKGTASQLLTACIKAYKREPEKAEPTSFKQYVHGAFSHFGNYHLSRTPKYQGVSASGIGDDAGDFLERTVADTRTPNPQDVVIQQEMAELLLKLAEVLPKEQKALIDLFYENHADRELTLDAIGGHNRGKDQQHLNRALRALRKLAQKDSRFSDIASEEEGR